MDNPYLESSCINLFYLVTSYNQNLVVVIFYKRVAEEQQEKELRQKTLCI